MVDLLEEEDAQKLKMLEAYISSVAIASVTQQKADEQHVRSLRDSPSGPKLMCIQG